MTLVINGGPALPVNVVTDGRPVMAQVAYPVHTFVGLAGITDGRKVIALPAAQPVVYINASDLDTNGGPYHLSALPAAQPVITGLGLQSNGGHAVALYEVSDPFPAPYIPPAPVWWAAGGAVGCVAAYQPKGAASYAASLIDLSGSGNNAFAGSAPTWDAVNGWTGDGIGKYLRTGVVPTAGWSHLVQFTGGLALGTQCVAGSDGVGSTGFFAFGCSQFYGPAEVFYSAGANYRKAPPLQAGNLGGVAKVIVQGGGYRNGMFEAGTQTAGGPDNKWNGQGYEIYLLCVNTQGAAAYFFSGSIQAYAVYNNSLSDAQMLAVATAMAAL